MATLKAAWARQLLLITNSSRCADTLALLESGSTASKIWELIEERPPSTFHLDQLFIIAYDARSEAECPTPLPHPTTQDGKGNRQISR